MSPLAEAFCPGYRVIRSFNDEREAFIVERHRNFFRNFFADMHREALDLSADCSHSQIWTESSAQLHKPLEQPAFLAEA